MSVEWSKVVGPVVYPIGALWTLHLVFFLWSAWRKKWGQAFAWGFMVVLIQVIGNTSVPYRLLAGLEEPYLRPKGAALPVADVAIMLGGVMEPSSVDLFGGQVFEAGDRVLLAGELLRQKKISALVLGGAERKTQNGPWLEADSVQRFLSAWGLASPTNLLKLEASKNTMEEASQLRDLAKEKGWKKVILITSASHMKRSEALFRKLGIQVETLACDFVGTSKLEIERPFCPFPRWEGFQAMQLYMHEKVGWTYYSRKGWI